MRSAAPALMPIFRSRGQAELLAWLLLHPDQEYTLSNLAEQLGTPLPTMHREAQRLVDAGILIDRSVGRSRLLRANPDNRANRPLTELLELTFGAHPVVSEEFDLPGVDRVVIYGSWAARYHGAAGRPPRDIDVLVVGEVERSELYDAADRAQNRLGVEVNPVLRTGAQWEAGVDPLVCQVKSTSYLTVYAAAEQA